MRDDDGDSNQASKPVKKQEKMMHPRGFLQISQTGTEVKIMKAEEALEAAAVKKEEGNAKFKAKDLAEADICYKDALNFL